VPEREPNGLKKKMRAGKPVGILSGHHNPDMVDFLGQFGIDGVWIETEHGPVDWDEIGDFSRACDLWGMASIVRIPVGEPWVITRVLDRGASGFVVPHVSTKAYAQQIARSAHFAPLGDRGMYGGRRSFGVSDYYNRANEEVCVVVLIEEIEAVRNLDEILTVDGIDVFFVAPSDLAQTMGHIGNVGHPDVQRTIDDSLKKIVDAGKIAGTLVTDENRDHYMDLGVKFVYTGWPAWVANGLRSFKAALEKH
jgi:4-hydroxy-2-oxoheptanedioate aldolase